MPCARMHSDVLSSCAWACADGGPEPGRPPGSSFPQFFWADWKDGEAGLTPDPIWILKAPPLPLGSGKFATPCDRMQSANLIPCEAALEAEAALFEEAEPDVLEEPHAAIATPQTSAGSARGRRCPVVDTAMSQLYAVSDNTEVTGLRDCYGRDCPRRGRRDHRLRV